MPSFVIGVTPDRKAPRSSFLHRLPIEQRDALVAGHPVTYAGVYAQFAPTACLRAGTPSRQEVTTR